MLDYLEVFLRSETPFTLLFIALFFFVMRRNKDREKRLEKVIDGELKAIREEQQVLIKVWKILLEKELKNKEEKEK
jgi:hypothetical protein